MYLKNLKIWNFRKIGTSDNDLAVNLNNPGIDISFNPKINVLIGENDSGKTAVIDAIRYVLGTQSYDIQRIDEKDFHVLNQDRTTEIKIECLFAAFSPQEAGQFLEWIHTSEAGEFELRIWLSAFNKDNRVITNIRAGIDDEGTFMDGNARDLLRVTYLKPLRDAEAELTPGYRSRLAQILKYNPVFKKEKDQDGKIEDHPLEKYIQKANVLIKEFYSEGELKKNKDYDIKEGTLGGKSIKDKLNEYLRNFLHNDDNREPFFEISEAELPSILRKLSLDLEKQKTGLGVLNLL